MTRDEKVQLLHRIYACFNDRNWAAIDDLFAADYRDYSTVNPTQLDRDGLKEQLCMWVAAFPDARWTVEHIIIEGDEASWQETFMGTHQGELMGIPPTGRPVRAQAISQGRLVGGRAVAHWSVYDIFGMMVQMGVIPMPGAAPVAAG